MRKPTLHDVAAEAGVSYATADRVVNARGGVARKSELRVRDAIERLGYMRDLHAANLSRRRVYSFRFLLPDGDHSFFRMLRAALEAEKRLRALDRTEIAAQLVPVFDADELARRLEEIEPGDCDAVAVVVPESERVMEAIARLKQLGVFVVTLVSDAPGSRRDAYIGIDNMAAGRTAGRLIRLGHRERPGTILPVLGSHLAKDHRDRLEGVSAVLAEPGSALTLFPAVEAFDQPGRMRAAVGEALRNEPGLTGIYSMGAGNRGLIEALRAHAPARRPLVILHELVSHSRAALEEGLVDAIIDQKPAQEIAAALDAMRALADRLPIRPDACDITPTIYLRDNLPKPVIPAGQGGSSP